MKRLMLIATIATIAGGSTALAVHATRGWMAQHNQTNDVQQLLQQLPPDPGPGNLDASQRSPEGSLPLDAAPEPGRPIEPGSARPAITFKTDWRPSWLGGSDPNAEVNLTLVRTTETVEGTKDPVWHLQLRRGSQVLSTLQALTGRRDRQTLNRHTSGTKAPLPPGRYAIERQGIERGPFADPEVGSGYWVPIQPLFNTGRSLLGLHHDPSWGKANGESGTSGCIGLATPEATAEVVSWIKHFGIRTLVVES